MADTLGKRITELRKRKGLTQDQLAEKLDVTPQAVSKWENDISCPDIMMLPRLADFFEVSVDELLRGQQPASAQLVPEEERKDLNKMILRMVVNSAQGDRVNINLPMALVKVGLEIGTQIPQINGKDFLKGIDFNAVLQMVESGLIGRIMDIDSADGDHVELYVE